MKHAFTLLELSIVLVIIGLIVGGVTVGAEMIRQAELRSVTSDVQKIETALYTFKLKYNQRPGDMTNATDYWGIAGGDGENDTCKNTLSTGSEATCNGNGDGRVGRSGGSSTSEDNEIYRAWQHLSNAGLWEGNFAGKSNGGVTTSQQLAGFNIPESKVTGGGYSYQHRENPTGISNQFPFTGHYIIFGAFPNSPVGPNAILTPAEAFAIDTKNDDGKPGYGKVKTSHDSAGHPNCATTTDESTAVYDLDFSELSCALTFTVD